MSGGIHYETRPQPGGWSTGFNMPGYMPDPDAVDHHATWEKARNSLIETITSHMDDFETSEDDMLWNQQVDANDKLRLAKADMGITVHAGLYAYWITMDE